jgi:hypothetical protein
VALRQRWPFAAVAALPDPATLTELLSIAYQGSLLQEEEHPVVGHLLFASRTSFVPPTGGHLVRFSPARPYTEQELRRLSPTVQQASSLLAVEQAADGRLQIWGMLFAKPASPYAPASPAERTTGPFMTLVLYLLGPGNLAFFCGDTRVLTLHQGRIEGHGFVQFPVAWGRGRFADALRGLQQQAQEEVGATLPVPDELLIELSQHLQRRIIARVRGQGHGGLLIFIPAEDVPSRVRPTGVLRPKYQVEFPPLESPYRCLALAVTRRLAELGEISWARYQTSPDGPLRALDAALGQFADALADLMAVDGALLLTKQLDIVGFGVEVHAPHITADFVYRALDLEATRVQAEPADSGGTRHRAAYRLCQADPASLVTVVSQDGGVKFVHEHAGQIIFWDQL